MALDGADFELYPGEIVAIIGDNGAGKSTLIKSLSGALQPDDGEIRLDGERVRFRSPGDARRAGIETVYQDLAVAPSLDIASNIFLGREARWRGPLGLGLRLLDKRRMRREAAQHFAELQIGVQSITQPVENLSGGQRQGVAVARAAKWARRLAIMDEPTAALGVRETRQVLDLIQRVRERGLPVIIISHDMPHVFELADRILIMRLGKRVAVVTPQTHTMPEAVAIMTGATQERAGAGVDEGGAAGMSLRWGFLSTARINRLVLEGARETDRAEVIAVASRDAARAEAYARDHAIERAYGSYDALLEDADVEAVYIPLPNSMHVEWTLRALEAGKHVLCEKPFSRHAEEVERAFDVADSAGLVLSEGFMWRHNPQTAKVSRARGRGCDWAPPGRPGRHELPARRRARRERRPLPTRARRRRADGRRVLLRERDPPRGRRAGARRRESRSSGESGVDVVFAGTLACADGVVGHFDCGFVLPRRGELEVIGEAGALFVPDPFHVASPGIELRREDGVEDIALERANSYQLELENVADAVRGDAPLLLGRDDAVGQARAIEALYRSAA